MTIDIDSLSPKELDALLSQAAKRKKTLAKRKPVAQVRKKLVAAAKAEGYTIAELFGGAAATREPKAAKPAKRTAKKAGRYVIACVLDQAAIRQLRRQPLTITWRVVFTPTDGTAAERTGRTTLARLQSARPIPVTG